MNHRPLLVLIPGGPGLTCDTLSETREAFEKDELLLLDPPSCKSIESGAAAYEAVLTDAEARIPSNRSLILCGHSAGGIFAAELALRLRHVAGLACMATPFSVHAWDSVGAEYERNLTPALKAAAQKFEADGSNENFRNWVAEYGTMYFIRSNVASGSDMIRRSRTVVDVFKATGEVITRKELLLTELSKLKVPKLFIYGEEDRLVIPTTCLQEAAAGGFRSLAIPSASHFMGFDNPSATNKALREFLNCTHSHEGKI